MIGLLGGCIGGDEAAQFVFNGVDVRLYGPSSRAVERVQKILGNTRQAYRGVKPVPLLAERALTVVASAANAVLG
ncbi:3-hydroxyacyl-CoA dehydrogenase, partial [Bradyrhizobium sp. UFLA05-109]